LFAAQIDTTSTRPISYESPFRSHVTPCHSIIGVIHARRITRRAVKND